MFSAIKPAHLEVLAVDPATITVERANKIDGALGKLGAQTTTELLMLLATVHADVEDEAGAKLIADFAARFAEHEAAIV